MRINKINTIPKFNAFPICLTKNKQTNNNYLCKIKYFKIFFFKKKRRKRQSIFSFMQGLIRVQLNVPTHLFIYF